MNGAVVVKKESLNIRVSELLKKKIKEQADKEQKSISEYVTDVLKRNLEKQGN